MSEQQAVFEKAMELIDAANSEDPNKVTADGREWPKELLYSQRMSDMLQRFAPQAGRPCGATGNTRATCAALEVTA